MPSAEDIKQAAQMIVDYFNANGDRIAQALDGTSEAFTIRNEYHDGNLRESEAMGMIRKLPGWDRGVGALRAFLRSGMEG